MLLHIKEWFWQISIEIQEQFHIGPSLFFKHIYLLKWNNYLFWLYRWFCTERLIDGMHSSLKLNVWKDLTICNRRVRILLFVLGVYLPLTWVVHATCPSCERQVTWSDCSKFLSEIQINDLYKNSVHITKFKMKSIHNWLKIFKHAWAKLPKLDT